MLPVMRERHARGAWVGWSGVAGGNLDPFVHENVEQIPVSIDRTELSNYYDGFSNRTLWPLYHDVIRPPVYRRSWFRAYRDINERFAEAAAARVARNGIVWVHDYHLHLVPGMVRERRPDVKIGYFLHIPFPGRGLFSQLPWREEILRGMLGADVIGMQTRYAARNTIDLTCWFAGAKQVRDGVDYDGRRITIDAFPISIDTRNCERIARSDEVLSKVHEIKTRLGGRKMLLGVDRMDYTKGIDTRLLAFDELLASKKYTADDVVMVQSAVPTREFVKEYEELRANVERLVGQINGDHGTLARTPVNYLRQNLPHEELISLYRSADVMLVTPLRDGMNLVAKEYVAARTDMKGSLVLSEFAGAVDELRQAIVVNPHHRDAMVSAMDKALSMQPDEQRRRLRSMRRTVTAHDVHAWAEGFLASLGE